VNNRFMLARTEVGDGLRKNFKAALKGLFNIINLFELNTKNIEFS
jgi:hypothetical protein